MNISGTIGASSIIDTVALGLMKPVTARERRVLGDGLLVLVDGG